VSELGLLARFVHLAASILIVGGAALLIIAGHSDRATAQRWQSRVERLTRALVVIALAAGIVGLAQQAASLEQRPTAAVEPAALWRVAVETQAGTVWIVRQSLLLLLGGFVFARADVSRRVDWRAARAYGLLLAGAEQVVHQACPRDVVLLGDAHEAADHPRDDRLGHVDHQVAARAGAAAVAERLLPKLLSPATRAAQAQA
jgi:putative copper export protein